MPHVCILYCYNAGEEEGDGEGGSDKSWLESELRTAKHNAEYYRNELKNPNISSTFRSSCEFRLEQALKKIAEITEKLSKLKN